jgi:purine-binding chemotaxis protein CheW
VSNLATESSSSISTLIVCAGARMYALALVHIIEAFRPLPIQTLQGLPPFVLGVSLVRGSATPVIDLNLLLGSAKAEKITRFVLLRVEPRPIALAVEKVVKICDLDTSHFRELPYMLHDSHTEAISMIGSMDQKLLLILQATRMIPQEIWEKLEAQQLAYKSSVP